MSHDPADRRRRFVKIAIATGVAAALAATAWMVVRSSTGSTDRRSGPAPVTSPPLPSTTGPPSPLTGRPSTTADTRFALVVKIDAAPGVSRFAGLPRADLIYEVLVEGGITRYLAIFQSEDAPKVGPVRSLRTSDFDLVANLDRPVVAFSGADALTLRASSSAPLIPFTPDSVGGTSVFRRDTNLRAPHNLFLSTTALRSQIDDPGTVSPPFAHAGPADPPPGGASVAGLRIRFSDLSDAVFEWDGSRDEWLRWGRGRPQTDDRGTQLGVDNLLVLFTEYTHVPWDRNSPQVVSVGAGFGLLLANGSMTPLTWRRESPDRPFTMTGPAGMPIALPPGRTWVAFTTPGTTTALDAAAVTALGRRN